MDHPLRLPHCQGTSTMRQASGPLSPEGPSASMAQDWRAPPRTPLGLCTSRMIVDEFWFAIVQNPSTIAGRDRPVHAGIMDACGISTTRAKTA